MILIHEEGGWLISSLCDTLRYMLASERLKDYVSGFS